MWSFRRGRRAADSQASSCAAESEAPAAAGVEELGKTKRAIHDQLLALLDECALKYPDAIELRAEAAPDEPADAVVDARRAFQGRMAHLHAVLRDRGTPEEQDRLARLTNEYLCVLNQAYVAYKL